MTYSQPQLQPISPQIHISNFERFDIDNARFFLLLGFSPCNGLDLQPSNEDVIPSENTKNVLMNRRKMK